MDKKGTQSGKQFQHFKTMEGFNKKQYVIYDQPGKSMIIPDCAETQEFIKYKGENIESQGPVVMGMGFALNRNQPQNITKQQKEIQERIKKGDNKASKVTVGYSDYLSIISDGNCDMCPSKDETIDVLQQQIRALEESNNDLQKRNFRLQDKIRTLALQTGKRQQENYLIQLQNKIAQLEKIQKEFQSNSKKVKLSFGRSQIDPNNNPQKSGESIIILQDQDPIIISVHIQDYNALQSNIRLRNSRYEEEELERDINQSTNRLSVANDSAFFVLSLNEIEQIEAELDRSLRGGIL